MYRSYKYRLYPNREQQKRFAQAFGCARWAYNWALSRRNEVYQKTGKTLTSFDLNKEMTHVKKQYPFLAEVSDWVMKEAIAHVGDAFKHFFDGSAHYPRFKCKSDYVQSATYRRVKIDGNRIHFAHVGNVKFVRDRKPKGEIKKLVVSKDACGDFWVSILCDDKLKAPDKAKHPTKAIGIDVGISSFCTTSDGEKIENPKYLKKTSKKLAHKQRKLSRKQKGSNRYKRQRKRVSRCHRHIANQHKDFLHNVSKRLIDENQVIAIENLYVKGMLQNHQLAKAISDCGWSEFVQMLTYKAEWYGVELLQCGRFDPSSKMCECGYVNNELTLKDRTWTCPRCERVLDRDVNAAKNILKFAVARTVYGRGGTIRPKNLEKYSSLGLWARFSEASNPLL